MKTVLRSEFMKFCKFLLLSLCSIIIALNLEAQPAKNEKKTIRGTIADEAGVPLSGVTVSIKDEQSTTQTDDNGRYTILYIGEDATIVFTYIGYEKVESKATNRSVINVTMKNQLNSLDDVVVIGYGTQKREKVIGSVSQVSGEQISNRPVSQLKNALTGLLPGVTITQRSGSPGVASGTISVRGVGSFGAAPTALILVDGTPVDNFNDINPNDVESISVLKDASSAAIYGSRAANGVILVTTKSGKVGKAQLSYNSYVGLQKPTAMPEFANSWEYQQAYFEAENGSSTLTAAQMATVEKYKAQNDPNYPNNNFLDLIIAKNALQTGHNIIVNGGTNTNKYNLSLGYLYQDGLVAQNNYSRYNLRSNTTTALGSKFNLTTRLAAIISKTNEPLGPAGLTGFSPDMVGIIGQAARTPNTLVGRYDNGDFGVGLGNAGTPISYLASKSFNKQRNLNLNANLRLDYKVVTNLKLSFISSYLQNTGRETSFRSTQRINSTISLGPNQLTESTNANYYYNYRVWLIIINK